MTIDVLPDDALLDIFDFYLAKAWEKAWRGLVHVCRRWRNIVFGSPRRLNLRLYCTVGTPVEMLDIWPPLPIDIGYEWGDESESVDNIVAALEHNERINAIDIRNMSASQFEETTEVEGPFPALTRLCLRFDSYWIEKQPRLPDVPDSFLGGFAPCLQAVTLERISFSGLPTLLLSATHLVHLVLQGIPFYGYISPDAMATGLSASTRLDKLVIEFATCRHRKSQRPPSPTRILLPVLTKLRFKGPNRYLEDLVARIDAPLLDKSEITFFCQRHFDTSQLARFISCTEKFTTHDKALVVFSYSDIFVTLPQTSGGALKLRILLYKSSKYQRELLSLAQICSSFFPLIPAVERLYIVDSWTGNVYLDSPDITEWSEFLRPFTAVKDLYMPPKFMSCIAPALQELVGDGVTGMLPALQTLYLELEDSNEDPTNSRRDFNEIVTARQRAGHPIVLSPWERKCGDW